MRTLTVLMLGCLAAEPAAALDAVARINRAGYRDRLHCTGSLIGPSQVLTAAHCLAEAGLDRVHVLPGYDRGNARAHMRPVAVLRPDPARDIALLCLAGRARTPALRLAALPPAPGERLAVIGYPLPSHEIQSRFLCTVTKLLGDGSFLLDCPLARGASGAPVLREGKESPEIVGVVSATDKTQSLAYGLESGAGLPACPPPVTAPR